MTEPDSDASVEEIAERLAARGHDALIERLRTAFHDAAKAHADIVQMDEQRIEALVQKSAQNADGLQWRRALANVACDELGIGLTDALNHPAVARAQQLVGAPSYEESLAELTRRPVPERAPEPEAEDEAEAEPEHPVYTPTPLPSEPPETVETAHTEQYDVEAGEFDDAEADEDEDEDEDEGEDEDEYDDGEYEYEEDGEGLRLSAIHLGGVANLPVSSEGIDLRLSPEGLDIMRGDDQILGRLGWREIDALEVPEPRGRRRRRGARARLVVRTAGGDASFEVPAFSTEELRGRIDPLVTRFARG